MKAMILGGVAPHIELIQALKKRDYETILVDYLDNPPARVYADKYYQVSTLDKEAVLSLAKEEKIDLIMTICVDHANVTMCYVAEQLGLPLPYTSETALNATDKDLMKQKMWEYEIPTSRFIVVSENESYDLSSLEFPLVIKPADNNGSKGVIKVNTVDEVQNKVENALSLSRNKKAVIEEFNDGREIQVDCFANNNVANVIMIREKLKIPNQQGLAMQSYGSILPPKLTKEAENNIKDIAQKIVKAFGFEHTPFFFQAIEKDGAVKVIELTPRIGGGLSYKLLKRFANFDIINTVIDSYHGNVKSVDFKTSDLHMVTNIVYAMNGVFDKVVGVEEMIANNIIESFDLMTESGKEFGVQMDSRNRVGAYYIVASSYEELLEKARVAHESIDVVDTSGRSIMRHDLYYHE